MDYDWNFSSLIHPFPTLHLVHNTSATLASLLFHEYTEHPLLQDFLSCLYPLPGRLPLKYPCGLLPDLLQVFFKIYIGLI